MLNAKCQRILPILVISYYFLIFTSIPLWDPDFWWHMKTGGYILNHISLPDKDPFTNISPERNQLRQDVILKGYWLAQVILHIIWSSFSIKGIILLRAIVLTLTLFIIYLSLRHNTAPHIVSIAILLVGGVLLYFTGERPQMFSFPIICLLVSLIDAYLKKGSRWFYAIPFLMLLWANLHGSFMLGTLLLGSLIVIELIKYKIGRSDLSKRQLSIFIIINIIAIGSSLINPVSYKPFLLYKELHSEIMSAGAIEHMSPIRLAIVYKRYFIYFWLLSAFVLMCIFLKMKINSWHLITLGLFILSLSGARYMVFFAIVAPFALKDINDLRIFNKKWLSLFISFIIILIIISGIIRNKPFNFSILNTYPHNAVNFIKRSNLKGNIFNYLDWGGFLMANLPDSRVFIDGRLLSEDRYSAYSIIIEGVEIGDKKEWKGLLNENRIDMIILPLNDPNIGEPLRLIPLLLIDKSWSLLYSDTISMVFVKR